MKAPWAADLIRTYSQYLLCPQLCGGAQGRDNRNSEDCAFQPHQGLPLASAAGFTGRILGWLIRRLAGTLSPIPVAIVANMSAK
jgi:hypothetical protein